MTTTVGRWLEASAPVFNSLTTLSDIATFLENFRGKFGRSDVNPDSEDGVLRRAIALYALDGRHEKARAALAVWQSIASNARTPELFRGVNNEFLARVNEVLTHGSARG